MPEIWHFAPRRQDGEGRNDHNTPPAFCGWLLTIAVTNVQDPPVITSVPPTRASYGARYWCSPVVEVCRPSGMPSWALKNLAAGEPGNRLTDPPNPFWSNAASRIPLYACAPYNLRPPGKETPCLVNEPQWLLPDREVMDVMGDARKAGCIVLRTAVVGPDGRRGVRTGRWATGNEPFPRGVAHLRHL